MTGITWTVVEDYDDRPEYGPRCPGPATHRWHLTVDGGDLAVGSGCPDCDLWQFPIEALSVTLTGSVMFHHAHGEGRCPNAARFLPCDCDYWWEFRPEVER